MRPAYLPTMSSAVLSPAISAAGHRVGSFERSRIKSPYQPHLDGLRALAIMGVLMEHLGVTMPSMLRFGPLSVRFFFVLTGYFITLSLWRMKDELIENADGLMEHLGRFYLSRLLRIGPPFYLALIVGALLGVQEIRSNFLWLATFQANHYIVYLGYWPNAISHFWSLAVQEQFYILWPLVVLALPKRSFVLAMVIFIFFGLGFRIYCISTNTSTIIRWVTLLGCFDSFATGALVAYLGQSFFLEKIKSLPHVVLSAMTLIAFSCFFLGRALMTLPEGNIWLGFTETVDAIFLAWLLIVSLSGIKNRYSRMLSWKPLVYLGRISYGIYVYHVFVIILISPLLLSFGLSENHYALIRLAILVSLTLIMASLSWHFMEKPFLAWKSSLSLHRKQPSLGHLQPSSV